MNIRFKSVKQVYLFNTVLSIKLNGTECAWIGNGEEITIKAPAGENNIVISDSIRKKEINFEAHEDVTIIIKRNRILGNIEALVTGSDVRVL